MITLIDRRLAFGPAPRRDDLDAFSGDSELTWVCVNLRERTEKSHWYADRDEFAVECFASALDAEATGSQIVALAKRVYAKYARRQNVAFYVHALRVSDPHAALVACALWVFLTEEKQDAMAFFRKRGHLDVLRGPEAQKLLRDVLDGATRLVPWIKWSSGHRK